MTGSLPNRCLVSGGDKQYLRSPLNHKVYAAVAGFDYRLEVGPFPGLLNKFYFKQAAVRAVLPRYEWVVWLDDDAFVTDFDRDVFGEQIEAAEANGHFLVIADSPVSASGFWTKINGGVFAMRNCPESFTVLDLMMRTLPTDVLGWWRPEEHGRFCNGDQDTMLWATETAGLNHGMKIVPHAVFNSRPYEYDSSATDHFVCHFPGVINKRAAISEFGRRFGRDDTLIAPKLHADYGVPTGRLLTPSEIRLVEAKTRARSWVGRTGERYAKKVRARTQRTGR